MVKDEGAEALIFVFQILDGIMSFPSPTHSMPIAPSLPGPLALPNEQPW